MLEDVFELLSCPDEELALEGLIQIRKQSALEDAEGPSLPTADSPIAVYYYYYY